MGDLRKDRLPQAQNFTSLLKKKYRNVNSKKIQKRQDYFVLDFYHTSKSMDVPLENSEGFVEMIDEQGQMRSVPATCPLESCKTFLSSTHLLSHFLNWHSCGNRQIPIKAIYGGQRVLLPFRPYTAHFNVSTIVAGIMYGGRSKKLSDRPAFSGLSRRNSLIQADSIEYHDHLPIFILMRAVSFEECEGLVVPNSKFVADADVTDLSRSNARDRLAMYLVSSGTSRPLYAAVTVFNQKRQMSHGKLLRIVPAFEEMNLVKEVAMGGDVLQISGATLNRMVDAQSDTLMMEILVHDYYAPCLEDDAHSEQK